MERQKKEEKQNVKKDEANRTDNILKKESMYFDKKSDIFWFHFKTVFIATKGQKIIRMLIL